MIGLYIHRSLIHAEWHARIMWHLTGDVHIVTPYRSNEWLIVRLDSEGREC